MKKLIIILSMFSICFGGDWDRVGIEQKMFLSRQSMAINSYNSIGFSNLNFTTIADLPSANPASITNFNALSAGFNMRYITTYEYFFGIDVEQNKPYLPSSAVITYSWKPFYAGLAYSQKYNSSLYFGEIPITTFDDMDGSSGQTFSPVFSHSVRSISGLVGYQLNKPFFGSDQLSFGLQISWNRLKGIEEAPYVKLYMDGTDWTWKMGFTYKLNEKIKMSILYDKGVNISTDAQFDSRLPASIVDTSGTSYYVGPLNFDYKVKLELPDQLAYGVSVSPLQQLWLNVSFTNVFWNQVNDNIKNELEYSFSAVYESLGMFSFSTGYYHTDYRSVKKYWFLDEDRNNLHYLGFGVGVNFNKVNLRFEALNSRILSSEKNTPAHFKIGFDYRLD